MTLLRNVGVLLQAVAHDVALVAEAPVVVHQDIGGAPLDVLQQHEDMRAPLLRVIRGADPYEHVAVVAYRARLRPAGQHLDPRLVLAYEVHLVQPPLHVSPEAFQLTSIAHEPEAQPLPAHRKTVPGEHLRLPVERQMVVELAHQDPGDEARTRRQPVDVPVAQAHEPVLPPVVTQVSVLGSVDAVDVAPDDVPGWDVLDPVHTPGFRS